MLKETQLGVSADLLGAPDLIRTKVLDFSGLHVTICPIFLSIVLLRHMKGCAASSQTGSLLLVLSIITGARGHPQSVHWIPLTAGSRLHDPVINQDKQNWIVSLLFLTCTVNHSARHPFVVDEAGRLLGMPEQLQSVQTVKWLLVVYKMNVEQCVPESIVKL